jgi:hypothetical protein
MKATKGSTEKAEPKTEKELTAIDKIRKLMEFSVENGATESEVENAIKLAQRLMMKHNLEQSDIDVTSKDINVTKVKSTWKDGMEARSFESQLLMVLGKTYSCKIVIDRNKATNTDTYDVIGLPEDREMLVATYESVLPQIRVITKKRFKEQVSDLSLFKFTTSYQTGFLVGLKDKLALDKDTFFKVADKKQFELIVVQKDALVSEWMAHNLKTKTGKVKQIDIDKESFEKGVADGSEKGLSKQLGK